jgi:nitric oxide synthase oxygenase domain/subunit
MGKQQRVVIVLMVALMVVASALLAGCGRGFSRSQQAAIATERTLTISTTIYDDGVGAIAERLKAIPITERDKRKPYIEALRVLEDVRKWNNALASWADYASKVGAVPDPEAVSAIEKLRRDAIISILPVLISVGVKIYEPYYLPGGGK